MTDYLALLRQIEARLQAEGKVPVSPGPVTLPATDAAEARYRTVARHVFYLARLGADAGSAECGRYVDELTALTDDLGPDRAGLIRHEEARSWWVETGCCPWCGEPGEYHEAKL
jgi:hypothetical protein